MFAVRSFLRAAVLRLFLPLSVWMEPSLSPLQSSSQVRAVGSFFTCHSVAWPSASENPCHLFGKFQFSGCPPCGEGREIATRGEGRLLGRFNPDQTRRCCTDWSYLEGQWVSAALAAGRLPGRGCEGWTGKARDEDIGPFCTPLGLLAVEWRLYGTFLFYVRASNLGRVLHTYKCFTLAAKGQHRRKSLA